MAVVAERGRAAMGVVASRETRPPLAEPAAEFARTATTTILARRTRARPARAPTPKSSMEPAAPGAAASTARAAAAASRTVRASPWAASRRPSVEAQAPLARLATTTTSARKIGASAAPAISLPLRHQAPAVARRKANAISPRPATARCARRTVTNLPEPRARTTATFARPTRATRVARARTIPSPTIRLAPTITSALKVTRANRASANPECRSRATTTTTARRTAATG
jgi:hypothetical protein